MKGLILLVCHEAIRIAGVLRGRHHSFSSSFCEVRKMFVDDDDVVWEAIRESL